MIDSEQQVLNEIIRSIEEDGKCEVPLSRLENTVFKRKDEKDWGTKAQILIWAVSQKLQYDYIEQDNDTYVLFYKNPLFEG